MSLDYIVVQAGGRGTRLGHLTVNKPKALVPVENLPMLFHLFQKFPEKQFIIIGDYQMEVLRGYLEAFATVRYLLVEAEGTGTCSGVENALACVPEGEPFLMVWSDLILPPSFDLPPLLGTYLGLSQSFSCRWSYVDGVFQEIPSETHGVAGLFIFPDKSYLKGVPSSGELVRWLSDKNYDFEELGLSGTREFGVLEEYEKLEPMPCRPFNATWMEDGIFYKKPLDDQGEALAVRERQWYTHVIEQGFSAIPVIHNLTPLTMDVVDGGALYQDKSITMERKRKLLRKIVTSLQELHEMEQVPVDAFSMKEAYYTKTMSRLQQVRDLIPMADQKEITINGKLCKNVFFHQKDLEQAISSLPCREFVLLHGDCTFSNIMLQSIDAIRQRPIFIDPRGYFGHTALYGDPNYDWAKLYYSIEGNYDQFNNKKFQLIFEDNEATVLLESNGWEGLEEDFFRLTGANPQHIQLIHAVIWLSLTTYAWDDYDSVCAAFYLGLFYLQEAFDDVEILPRIKP